MKVSNVMSVVAVLVLVISLLCIWFYPSVQDFMEANSLWNGLKNFSDEFGAVFIDSLDDLPDSPQGTALVLIPYVQPGERDLPKVRRFLENGGTLLLMDDFGYGNGVLEYLGLPVRFSGQALFDPLFTYKNPSMPRVTDFSEDAGVSGVQVVMLNHATTLTDVAESQVIAWSSRMSFLDIDRKGFQGIDDPKGPFTVAARLPFGKGTLAIVSDPSIMINSVAGKDDNHSFIRYLTSRYGRQDSIIIDRSHLVAAPLDVSKIRLRSVKKMMASPYSLLGLVALVFVVVSRYTLKKGEIIG